MRRVPWPWLLPLVVALLVYRLPSKTIGTGVAALLALGVVVLAYRSPGWALVVLVALMPFHLAGLSALYRFGAPSALVRGLGAWELVLGVGILAAGVRRAVVEGHRLDALDKLCLAYVAAVLAYLAVPKLFVAPASTFFAGPPLQLTVRLLSLRTEAAFVLLFFGVRHVRLPAEFSSRFVKALVGASVVMAGIGIFEFFFSSAWNTFAVHTIQVPNYEIQVLKALSFQTPLDVRYHGLIGSREIIRPGSVLFEPVFFAVYLLPAWGVLLWRVAHKAIRPATVILTAIIGVALLLTLTRAAILTAGVVAFAAFWSHSGSVRQRGVRERYGILLVCGLILVSPLAVSTGVVSRTAGGAAGTEGSTAVHKYDFGAGMRALGQHPLGLGLGAEPGVGDRFAVSSKVTTENAYLQVGDELGIPTMLLFIALLLVLYRRLGRAAAGSSPASDLAAGLRLGLLAMLIAGLFQHVWLLIGISWTMFGGMGLVIGTADTAGASPDGAVELFGVEA